MKRYVVGVAEAKRLARKAFEERDHIVLRCGGLTYEEGIDLEQFLAAGFPAECVGINAHMGIFEGAELDFRSYPRTTREEHLAWCKARALEYLPHRPDLAVSSFVSDMGKHPHTQDHPAMPLLWGELMLHGQGKTADLKRCIEGFQ